METASGRSSSPTAGSADRAERIGRLAGDDPEFRRWLTEAESVLRCHCGLSVDEFDTGAWLVAYLDGIRPSIAVRRALFDDPWRWAASCPAPRSPNRRTVEP